MLFALLTPLLFLIILGVAPRHTIQLALNGMSHSSNQVLNGCVVCWIMLVSFVLLFILAIYVWPYDNKKAGFKYSDAFGSIISVETINVLCHLRFSNWMILYHISLMPLEARWPSLSFLLANLSLVAFVLVVRQFKRKHEEERK